jgi:hypothetical protein
MVSSLWSLPSVPPAVLAVAGLAAALLLSIVPTALYLYVEPRSRLHWATGGDSPERRRAPWAIRVTAWLSFAVGQLAIPWLVVPVACGGLVYVQAKLGIARVPGVTATVALGAMALLEGFLAIRLIPLGIRLLMRDARASARILGRARTNATLSAAILGGSFVLGWGMAFVPGLVLPWLRVVLVWAALRPVQIYAAACLAHALLLGACGRSMGESSTTSTPSR